LLFQKYIQMKKIFIPIILLIVLSNCGSQKSVESIKSVMPENTLSKGMSEPEKRGYWQQYVSYTMDVDMDTQKHQYTGRQHLVYKNNSHDTLHKVFYHLYFNAFQPGSAMDWHARTLPDPDRKMDIIIQALKPDEIGFVKVHSLQQDGQPVDFKVVGTILEVTMNKALLPGQSTVLDMDFLTQIPKIVRRAGRDNDEGIDYSMSQWYPKLAEYDQHGWHADPYLGREFYGVWGDFDVSIHIDKKYTVAATGVLQNPEDIPAGKGYSGSHLKEVDSPKLTWHFKARNVHDFSWAADPDYVHDIYEVDDSLTLHFFYQNDEKIKDNWKKLQPVAAETMTFYNNYIGPYPYRQYSVIQAGDGGMEYAQLTFVNGNKPFESLRGTVQHEMGHAWFQFALATDETEFPWMDEGFTSFIQDMAGVAVNGRQTPNPFSSSYESYRYLVKEQKEEPLSTHSDHYLTNIAYWINAYDKGKILLSQLGYIMGFDNLSKTLKAYYKNWAMKHPQPDDFFRIAEKISGMDLKWYQNEWVHTVHHIDYKLDSLQEVNGKTKIIIKNIGEMPMPVDLIVVYTDESKEAFTIPLDLMRNVKSNPYPEMPYHILPVWQWAVPQYEFTLDRPKSDIKVVMIDPLSFMADLDIYNNYYAKEKPEAEKQ